MRGSGMSTLAVMASSALGFRVLDADHYFYKATNLSRAAYKSAHGISQYRQEELRLMRSMLFDNPTGAIIVCGPGAVEGTGKEWLAEYAKDHLIIYILRDAEDIQRHLRAFDVETIRDLTRRTASAYRKMSSFEFYNISDTLLFKQLPPSSRGDITPPALALKDVEEDFLHLIHDIIRRDDCYQRYKARNSLCSMPLVSRNFTYALSLPLSTLTSFIFEFRGVDMEADAIELMIPISSLRKEGPVFDDTIANHISRQIALVRRHIRLPIIYHIVADTSQATIEQDEYFSLLHHGLRLVPEYLCIDLQYNAHRIQHLIASKGKTKIIAHRVVSNPTEDGWDSQKRLAMVQRAQNLGCDIVRICQESTSLADNFAAQHFINQVKSSQEHTIPIIAYNTGKLGRTSQFLNSILSPVTHALVRKLAPDCPSNSLLTVQEAQNAIYSSFLLDHQHFGVYGNNIAKSVAPAMHNAAFRLLGMPHRYNIFLYESLKEFSELIKGHNLGGIIISTPFKTDVMPMLDFMSDEAKAIGAVNTVLCLKSPTVDSLLDRNRAGPTVALFGENTDWIGIHTCVQKSLSPINAVRCRTTGLIVGSGGVARAAAYALIRLGLKTIFIHSRSRLKSERLVKQFEGRLSDTTFRIIDSKEDQWPEDASLPTIIVSCVTTRDINGKCSVDTSLPENWLSSPTGGVAIEVSECPYKL